MKATRSSSSPRMATFLAVCLGLASCDRDRDRDVEGTPPTASPEKRPAQAVPDPKDQRKDTEPQAPPDTNTQRKDNEHTTSPEIEKQRREAEQQAEKTLDKDAIAAVDESRAAARTLAENKPNDAVAAIERAIGKIDVLLARNPATALIPVRLQVEVIDGAPEDIQAIKDIEKALDRAVSDKNYPAARVVLLGLMSEIRVRTSGLPLASYPAALREAARLIDQKKTKEAGAVLQTALNTLVIVDRVTPLPLVFAQAAIDQAQTLRDKDRDAAQRLLATARHELDRAKELGYSGNDPEYDSMRKAISDLEAQLKGKDDTTSAFTRLKEKVTSFFKRQSQTEWRR